MKSRFVVLLALLALLACRRDQHGLGREGTPLVVLLSPGHGDAASARTLGEALSRESGLQIEVRLAKSPAEALSEAGSAQVDAGIVSIFQYLLARREYGVTAGLQVVRDGQTSYGGVIWGRADAVKTAAELEGKTVAFIDRSSATGYLLAARYLEAQKIHVVPLYTGSHEASVRAVLEGRAVAMATFAQEAPQGMTLLAATGEVPNEPVFFRRDLPAAERERLVQALLALAKSDAGRAALAPISGVTGFRPIDDAAYQSIDSSLESTRHRLEDLVPDGWQVVNEHRRPLSDLGQF